MNRALSKRLIYYVSKTFPFRLMRQLSNHNLILPFYHLVTDAPSPLVKHLYPVSNVGQFIKDLDFLQHNFDSASFDEVLDFAGSKSYTGKPKFFLSFDDGFSECFNVILPILKERKLPAAFFINPAFVGNRQLSHRQKVSLIIEHILSNGNGKWIEEAETLLGVKFKRQVDLIKVIKNFTIADTTAIDELAVVFNVDFNTALQKYKPYMDVSQLRMLQDAGYIIGSHSYDHPEFNLLSEDEMKDQINRSFEFLERELDVKVRIFSFPFHDIGVPLSFFYLLQNDAGVRASFGTSGIKSDNAPGHIHRIPMELKGFKGAESIIRSEYFYYLGKALAGKNLVQRR